MGRAALTIVGLLATAAATLYVTIVARRALREATGTGEDS
jgi:type II secretory pathway pseudopilin PulG